jgi:uncharacterized protein YegL
MSETALKNSSPSAEAILVEIDEFNLSELSTLDGTALGAVLKELRDDASTLSAHNSHHSHSSFSKHGTAMW